MRRATWGPGAGSFWLTGQNLNLGPEIVGTPIILRKKLCALEPDQEPRFQSAARVVAKATASTGTFQTKTFEVFFPTTERRTNGRLSARWRNPASINSAPANPTIRARRPRRA